MEITEFVRQVPGFSTKNHPEKIKAFGWFLHPYKGQDRFSASNINKCYDDAHLERPANTSRFLQSLTERTRPDLLRDGRGYRLAQQVRDKLDQELGQVEAVVIVEKMLGDLPGRIADEGERLFLNEVLTCYKHNARRAAIVMVWNLAYDHLARWILNDAQRLAAFNAGVPKRNPRKANITITRREDFDELKEDETVDIVGGLPGFSPNIKRLLKEKLGRRNGCAHPSTALVVERAQVDDMITDLVNNVVLNLKLK